MKRSALRAALVARCLVCIFFAWRLYASSVASASDLAGPFSQFVLMDGLLAIVLAALVAATGWHRAVAGIAALDGVMRLAAYVVLRVAPGIPGFAVTLVVFAASIAIFGFLFGVLDLVEATRLRRATDVTGLSAILGSAGLGTIVLGVTQFVMAPSVEHYRDVLIAGAALESLTMFAVALLAPRNFAPELAVVVKEIGPRSLGES